MEGVAAAASIAGIITLAAQAIDGLQKLHSFFIDISTASKTISRLLSDINSLISILHNIDNVLNQAETQRQNQNFASLDIKVDDCTRDVKSWLETAKALRSGGEKGAMTWVRRARLAGKVEVVARIREEIGRHRQALCLSLAVFGRTIDLHTSEQIYQMRGRFDDALTTSMSSHGAHGEALRRIEQYSITSMRSSAYSLKSMDSIRSELSRLEAMITSSRATSTSRLEQYETEQVGSNEIEGETSRLQVTNEGVTFRARAHLVSGHPLEPSDPQETCKDSSSASLRSSNISSSKQTDSDGKINVYTHPADYHILVKEQEDISKRFSEISNGHGSALLYAQFSRTTSPAANASDVEFVNTKIPEHNVETDGKSHTIDPTFDLGLISNFAGRSGGSTKVPFENLPVGNRQLSRSAQTSISERVNESSDSSYGKFSEAKNRGLELDRSSTYNLLQQSLAVIYPAIVADYISLQDLATSYQGHLKVLEESPIAMLHSSEQPGNSLPTSVQPHIRKIRDRLEVLQEAVDIAARKCISAGWSKPELDRLLPSATPYNPTQEGAHSPAAAKNRSYAQTVEKNKDDGIESEDSDVYLSATE